MRSISLGFVASLMLICASAFATDHNEPDLLNSFYRDRDGSGADIYHIFAYPNKAGDKLNLVLTLAPVPETGRFDPESVQRIYLCPAARPTLNYTGESELMTTLKGGKSLVGALETYRKEVLGPIVKAAGKMLIGRGFNDMAIDQTLCPEIITGYSKNGLVARLTFKNFQFDHAGSEQVIVESNGAQAEVDPKKIKKVQGIEVFVGGRDDAFFVDLGGFFRSMNWSSALDKDREFIWEGGVSYLDSSAKKEAYSRAKRLLDRNKSEIVYNGADSRAGNNINAIAFTIPISRLTKNVERDRIIRVWAESFLTESAYKKITAKE